jgi:hypothetical protein
MKSPKLFSLTGNFASRKRRAALLCSLFAVLLASPFFWFRVSADAPPAPLKPASGQESPDELTYGVAETVGAGKTVSVRDLKTIAKLNSLKKAAQAELEEKEVEDESEFFIQRRRMLSNPPDSPAVSAWPLRDAVASNVGDAVRNSPQTVNRNFLGIIRTEAGGATPPDSHGAVGPTQVILAVNLYVKSFNKTTGNPDGVLNLSLNTFFSSVSEGGGLFDPRIKFDPISRRWFLSALTNATTNRIVLAVSSGPEITNSSSFTFYSFAAIDGGGSEAGTPFADFDTLGIDAKGVYIGVNVFNASRDTVIGSTVFVLNKPRLLSQNPTLTVTAFRRLNNGSGPGPSTPHVADNPDPAATEAYLIGHDNVSLGLLVLRRIVGADTLTPAISGNLNLTVPTTAPPINVPIRGRSVDGLDSLDDRLVEPKVRNGRLWTAQNIQVDANGVASSSGGRTGSRWYEIGNLSTTPTLIQAGTLFSNAAASPDSFWMPSIGITGQGHAALGCSAAGPNRFPDIVYAGRLRGDQPGALRSPTTAVTGTNSYFLISNRWGDYSQVATDPDDDMTMWTFQEYAPSISEWGVRAIQLVAPPPATIAGVSPASAAQGQTLDVTVTGTATNGEGFYTPPAPFPKKIAANFGPGVVVNRVTVNSPTQAVFNITVQGGATTGIRNLTVTNPDGQATTASNVFTVNAGCAAPIAVSPATLPDGIANVAYVAQTAVAAGGVAPYAFTVATGPLPPGLALSSGGVLSGTPTATGTFTFTILATDNAGCTGGNTYTITVGTPVLAQGAVSVTSGNTVIEPNECNTLTVALSNFGTSEAGNVSATLSTTTPGVTITNAGSAYPTIPAGGASRTNTTAFQISTSSGITCFSTISFTLNVTYAGGSATFNFTRGVGQPAGTNYAFTATSGATIPGTPGGGTLVPGTQFDDGIADVPLPNFTFLVYGVPVSTILVDTNGNLRIDSAGSTLPTNGNLPSSLFPGGSPILLPYWDDLDMSPSVTNGGGIYTQTVGTAPNRQFVVEWRARRRVENQTLGNVDTNFAVVFNENSNRFSYVYALTGAGAFEGGASATVGVQGDTVGTNFTQFSINSPALTNGLRLDAAFPSAICSSGAGPCAACVYQVAPASLSVPAKATTGSLAVTTSAGCNWTAASNAPWLTVLSGAAGSGNGTVQIRAASNESGSARSGTLTVAGQTVTVNQARPNASTPGQYRPSNGFVYVRNTNDTGIANNEFFYGVASDIPIAGDWDGDGVDTIGIYRDGQFFLRNSNNTGNADLNFAFGAPGDLPIAGDWDGDGIDTVGLVRGNLVFLRNSNTTGAPDVTLVYGTGTDIYIAGDWNGDGIDTIGCFRPTNGFVYLRNTNTTGIADLEFFYGIAGDKPVAGDWNADGIDTIGIVRGNQWFLRNTNTTGFADINFVYGTTTDVPIVGDWDGQP